MEARDYQIVIIELYKLNKIHQLYAMARIMFTLNEDLKTTVDNICYELSETPVVYFEFLRIGMKAHNKYCLYKYVGTLSIFERDSVIKVINDNMDKFLDYKNETEKRWLEHVYQIISARYFNIKDYKKSTEYAHKGLEMKGHRHDIFAWQLSILKHHN